MSNVRSTKSVPKTVSCALGHCFVTCPPLPLHSMYCFAFPESTKRIPAAFPVHESEAIYENENYKYWDKNNYSRLSITRTRTEIEIRSIYEEFEL